MNINFIYNIIQNDLNLGKYTKIHTRFPPEPNGYLHIGHAKAIFLNFGLAKHFNGICNLRFDDTNPSTSKLEFIDAIKNDINWLGLNLNGKITYSSDYFDKLYFYALELIKKNLAYVDELSLDDFSKYRGTLTKIGKNSPYRNRTISENLFFFEKMRNGNFSEGKACLRAKIDMSSPFLVLRDPVLYRIKFSKHNRTENKWCIYPMYDFAHCISDVIEGITHSLCSLEFQDNRRLYDWILNNLNFKNYPHQYEFSRLNLEKTILSKRKLNILVNNHIVDGWDDPRMPTIAGLRRRGYTAKSIRKFCTSIGVTKQESIIKISLLEFFLRKELNNNAKRVMAVINPLKIEILNFPQNEELIILMLNHPQKKEMGVRKVIFSREIYIDKSDFCINSNVKYKFKRLILGEEVRLRNAFIIKAEDVEKDKNGKIIKIICSYDPNTLNKNPQDGRKVKGVIHWVSAKNNIAAEFRLYEHLFLDNYSFKKNNLCEVINNNSLVVSYGFIENSILNNNKNTKYQFEREGYFCYDIDLLNKEKPVFNRIAKLPNKFD